MEDKKQEKNVKVLMKEWFKWERYSFKEGLIWFKGGLININLHDFFMKLSNILDAEHSDINKVEVLLRSINGQFAVVIEYRGFILVAVDKIRSIPLFYFESEHYYLVGNHAPMLIGDSSVIKKTINNKSTLEVLMSGYTIGRKTLINDLYQLTAGEFILFDKKSKYRSFYYTYSPWRPVRDFNDSLLIEVEELCLSVIQDTIDLANGREILIPLSAGSDSRLIASGLKYLGAKNIKCISYGHPDGIEVKTSKVVAQELGYLWENFDLSCENQKKYFESEEYFKYLSDFESFSSVPFVQDLSVISRFHAKYGNSDDFFVVNGNTGDFISGGHIPNLPDSVGLNNDNPIEISNPFWKFFFKKHFSLWENLLTKKNMHYIYDEMTNMLLERDVQIEFDNMCGVYECAEYLGRQSKHIMNMQRSYDYNGYSWYMPLWNDKMLDFWESVPYGSKLEKKLYNDSLIKANWGNVWDIPINEHARWDLTRISRVLLRLLSQPLNDVLRNNLLVWYCEYFQRREMVGEYLSIKEVFSMEGKMRNRLSWRSKNYIDNFFL